MERRINFEICRVYHLMERHFENEHECDGISRAQGSVIRLIAMNPGRDIFQRDVEKEFGIRRSTVSVMLSSMESSGLIKREAVDYDARLKRLVLTPKTNELVSSVAKAFDEYDKVLMHGITDNEAEVFFRVLDKIAVNSEQHERKETEND